MPSWNSNRRVLPQRISPEVVRQREAIEKKCEESDYRVLRRLLDVPETELVVSFGGGGVPALAINAALAALLEELQLRPRVREIWGTSAGAVIGGAWSTGCPPTEMLARLEGLNFKGSLDFAKWESLGRSLLALTRWGRLPDGLVGGRHYHEATRQALKLRTFEECPIPFRAIACTDDGRAQRVIFRQGPLLEAIKASMCLPGVFHPVRDRSGEPHGYFDGGLAEKTPLLAIIEENARKPRPAQLLIICTHCSAGSHRPPPRGFLARFVSATLHLEDLLWEAQLERAGAVSNCRIIVLNPHVRDGSDFDFSYIRNNYLVARQQFKEQLSNAGLALRFAAR